MASSSAISKAPSQSASLAQLGHKRKDHRLKCIKAKKAQNKISNKKNISFHTLSLDLLLLKERDQKDSKNSVSL